MQRFFGLPPSGELTQETLAVMKRPRCGLSDALEEENPQLQVGNNHKAVQWNDVILPKASTSLWAETHVATIKCILLNGKSIYSLVHDTSKHCTTLVVCIIHTTFLCSAIHTHSRINWTAIWYNLGFSIFSKHTLAQSRSQGSNLWPSFSDDLL